MKVKELLKNQRGNLPIHPFLITGFPVLYLYTINIWGLRFSDISRALIISLLAALVLLIVTSLIYRSVVRGAVLASLILIFFASYGHVFGLVVEVLNIPVIKAGLHWRLLPLWGVLLVATAILFLYGAFIAIRQRRHPRLVRPALGIVFGLWLTLSLIFFPLWWNWYLLPLWGLLFLAAVLLVFKADNHLGTVSTYLNIVAGLLVLLSLVQVGVFAISRSREASAQALSQTDPAIGLGVDGFEEVPDIYYIILDSYAREDALGAYFGYDNGEFVSALQERGFYVATQSCTNYPNTILSLSTSLNLEYINHILEQGEDFQSETRTLEQLYQLLQENTLSQVLRQSGYEYVHLPSHWGPTDSNRQADITYDTSVYPSDFEMTLVKSTALNPLVPIFRTFEWRQVTLDNYARLAAISHFEEPTFTFAHFLVPHAPYVFDRQDGKVAPNDSPVDGTVTEADIYADNAAYVDQIVFVNRATISAIDEIITHSDVPPIIVLQGDHGQWPAEASNRSQSRTDFEAMRGPILNAYYLPQGGDTGLYASITPVNSFRWVLDYYFGTDLGLLDDKTYYPEDPITAPYILSEMDCS